MIRAALWDGIGNFEKRVEIEDAGKIPEVLIVDGQHYIQSEDEPRADGSLDYRRAVGTHTVFTQSPPIRVVKLIEDPVLFEAKRMRFLNGCHGMTYMRYDVETSIDENKRVSWNSKVVLKATALFEIRAVTPFRINGVWCPEMPSDQALRSLAFANAWKGPVYDRAIFRMSAIAVDEYGRMVVDLSKIIPAKFKGEDQHVLFSKPALESGLFLPTRLEIVE
jgi:hypothetical protein